MYLNEIRPPFESIILCAKRVNSVIRKSEGRKLFGTLWHRLEYKLKIIARSNLTSLIYCRVTGSSFEHKKVISGLIKYRKFLDHFGEYKLLKKCDQWNLVTDILCYCSSHISRSNAAGCNFII